jgi:hypothetical protein
MYSLLILLLLSQYSVSRRELSFALHGIELRHDRLRRHQIEMAAARALEESDDICAKAPRHSAAD